MRHKVVRLYTDLKLWRQENISEYIQMCTLADCKFPFSNKTLSGSTSAHGVVRHGLSVLRICALTSMKWGASDQKYITRSFQNLKVTVLSFGTILPLKQNLMCGGAGYGSHSLLEAMILNRGACRPSSFEQAAVQRLNRKETHHHSDAFPLHSSVKKSTFWIVAIIIMTGSPTCGYFGSWGAPGELLSARMYFCHSHTHCVSKGQLVKSSIMREVWDQMS